MTRGKEPRVRTISNATLGASSSEYFDLLRTYPEDFPSLPYDTISFQADRLGRVILNDDPKQTLSLTSKGAFTYGGLYIWRIQVINDDAVTAMVYSMTLQQSGV